MKTLCITIILSLFFTSNVIGQEKKANDIKHTYYYSFSNVSSVDQIEHLKEDISALKSVVKVTSEYKEEKAMGQVVVIVIEPQRTSEGQVLFSVTDLKRLISENNLTPHQLQEEKEIIIKK